MFFRTKLLVILCIVFGISGTAHSQVPGVLDGSFHYQGYLEFEGAPANGAYYFRFSIFDSDDNWLGALYSITKSPVMVVDGLFNVNVLMGGDSVNARQFWKDYGHLVKYLEIEVSEGPLGLNWTMLSPRVEIGSSAHALYAMSADALRFPYTETYLGSSYGNTDTMLSLSHQFGGTVLEASAGAVNTENPVILVNSATPTGVDYGSLNGVVQIDAGGRLTGILSVADQYPMVSLIETNTGNQNAAILGQIGSLVPGATALEALNLNSDNYAFLGTPNYSGDFSGDVLVRNNLRVQGEPIRDYAINSPSPIGPLAYGTVSSGGSVSSGTANLSAVWDTTILAYRVSISGASIGFLTHTVSIAVVDTFEPRLATYNYSVNNIIVKIWDLNSGNVPVQDNFSIVIYDSNPVMLNRMTLPDGVDADKYSEKTGAMLIQTQPRNEPIEPVENYGSGVTSD